MEADQLLTLKVMRLTKPKVSIAAPMLCEPCDLPGSALHAALGESITTTKDCELLRLSEAVTLPQSFGLIYLGETFSSYVSVHNDSNVAVQDVVVKIEMRTGTQNIGLTKADEGVASVLDSQKSCDLIVHHEVKELGQHTLICAVSYTADGDAKLFRKFYKFNVTKPLDVRTKAYNMESDVFLEAHLENIMTVPMFLQTVVLHASPCFNVTDLNEQPKSDQPPSFANLLSPHDTRQFLYKLTAKPGSETAARIATTIGKLDIVWKTQLCEVGRLQTSQLPRKPPVLADVQASVAAMPAHVVSGEPFEVTLSISNFSKRAVTLKLMEDRSQSEDVLLHLACSPTVGPIAPNEDKALTICFLAVKTGLRAVRGLALMDTATSAVYEVPVPDVFVHRSPSQ